jgi:hypothetical protein
MSDVVAGAYWAALTHPATNDALVLVRMSEVRMLSALTALAERADAANSRRQDAGNDAEPDLTI